MAHATHSTTIGAGIFARLAGAYEAFKTARTLRRDFRTTVRELRNLDDRELADLGISRAEITSIAMRHTYGK